MFRWYVVNTYSGHENKVKHNLEHRVVSLNQQRAVRQIVVPPETVSEMKDNQKVTHEQRTIPGDIPLDAARSFTLGTKSPPAAILIKQALNLDKGSAEPNRNKVGKITQ